MQMLFGSQEMNIICCHQPYAHLAPDALRLAQRSPIAGREVLHFDVEAVGEGFF